jgi:hypothetical protein
MGAINLVTEYQKKLANHFSTTSKTDAYAGKAYNFAGVHAIEVYTIDDIDLNDYTRSGTTRFGDVSEVEDTKQTLTMTKDRAFTKSIDKGNANEQYNIKRAAQVLQMIDKRAIAPEIDKYRLLKWAQGNGLTGGHTVQKNASPAALSADNIMSAIFNASAALSEKLVPLDNRVLFIGEADFVFCKLANVVLGGAQLNAEAVKRGFRGTIDGIQIQTVPTAYIPSNVGFILKYKGATVDPVKLKSLRVHKDPPGIDGDLLEGRVMYDAFVLDAMRDGVYIWKTYAGAPGSSSTTE